MVKGKTHPIEVYQPLDPTHSNARAGIAVKAGFQINTSNYSTLRHSLTTRAHVNHSSTQTVFSSVSGTPVGAGGSPLRAARTGTLVYFSLSHSYFHYLYVSLAPVLPSSSLPSSPLHPHTNSHHHISLSISRHSYTLSISPSLPLSLSSLPTHHHLLALPLPPSPSPSPAYATGASEVHWASERD